MKFNIITLGCKVNAYESEIIKENMLKNNFVESNLEQADIVIINTCSVTNVADNKSKKHVRQAKRLNKIVVVCGCSSENKQIEYQNMGIDILIGNKDKSNIHEKIKEFLIKKERIIQFYTEPNWEFEDMEVQKFSSQNSRRL